MFLLTLDFLKKFILQNINLLEGLAYLLLPQGDNLIEGQNVGRRSQIENLVQGSRIINCFYGISGNIFFLDKNCCYNGKKTTKKTACVQIKKVS